jgi:hypothetical protein
MDKRRRRRTKLYKGAHRFVLRQPHFCIEGLEYGESSGDSSSYGRKAIFLRKYSSALIFATISCPTVKATAGRADALDRAWGSLFHW